MKKTILNPLAAMTLASFTMFGCASSNDTSSTSAMDMNRSETSQMGGFASDADDNTLDVMVFEQKLMVPVATLSVTALAMENPVDVNDMFEDIEDTERYDVLSLAKTNPNLSTFVKLIERANLEDDLKRVDKLTIFAPTNEAFAKLPKDKLEDLLKAENTAKLSSVLQAHVLSSEVLSTSLQNNTRIRMTEQSYIPVTRTNAGMVSVGGAQIVKGDVEASNGRIHVIDSVILPDVNAQEE